MIKNVYLINILITSLLLSLAYFYSGRTTPKKNYVSDSKYIDHASDSDLFTEINKLNEKLVYLTEKTDIIYQNIMLPNDGTQSLPSLAESDNVVKAKFEDKQLNEEKNNTAKLMIMNSLIEPGVSLTDVTESSNMKNLPVDIQNEIMEEIVRKFNNGEIDKSQFIPGYTE